MTVLNSMPVTAIRTIFSTVCNRLYYLKKKNNIVAVERFY